MFLSVLWTNTSYSHLLGANTTYSFYLGVSLDVDLFFSGFTYCSICPEGIPFQEIDEGSSLIRIRDPSGPCI